MSAADRQIEFERAARGRISHTGNVEARKSFGLSNGARAMPDGLFAGSYNFETRSNALMQGTAADATYLLISQLPIPPQHEVYIALDIAQEAAKVDQGLRRLHREGEGRNIDRTERGLKAGKINNNVMFYAGPSGDILFKNQEVAESIVEAQQNGEFADDCSVSPDAIYFSVWPPAASVVRSLIVREFVAYLGDLFGREKVHEIRVWTDSSEIAPEMQRTPKEIPLREIEEAVTALGGHYAHGEVARIHSALNFHPTKHFVILAGLSGTGKTQLALKYARAVHGITSVTARDPFLFVCPVRPEWTDPTGLTGYYDVLSDRYVVPPFLEAVQVALAHPQSPVFVVLDELNLARVEYYFSDVLSAIETGEELQLHSSEVPLEGSTGVKIPSRLALPANLYIVGTINIDETTSPISDKVLDRAHIIDMSRVDLPGFLSSLVSREPSLEEAGREVGPLLVDVHGAMAASGAGFGYRVAEEVLRYHAFEADAGVSSGDTIDNLMVQKILAKLRGSERQRQLLLNLGKALAEYPRSQELLARLVQDLDEFGSFQTNR